MTAYYNEIEPKAVLWLKELIKQGHIAPGDVDNRSIEDVTPNELKKYTQCHFFAGIGVWSYALRQAGWPDDRPVWTGSCPCQPFSAAGKGKGVADERHLWPAFYWQIAECQPPIVFGEQVAQKAGAAWFDIVQSDLERENYAVGVVVFPACGVGAPHQRQRQYWLADANSQRFNGVGVLLRERQKTNTKTTGGGTTGGMANSKSSRRSVYNSPDNGKTYAPSDPLTDSSDCPTNGRGPYTTEQQPGPTNGQWGIADWLFCRDGKWRAVEPGTFPLVDGAAARVGRLRGYGNAIVAPQAQIFIESYLEGCN